MEEIYIHHYYFSLFLYISIINTICKKSLIPYLPERKAKNIMNIYIQLGYSCLCCCIFYNPPFLKM